MIQIQASQRLQVQAADANEKKAKKYLTECGFTGLELKSNRDDVVVYHFEKYDKRKVAKMLGEPKGGTKSESMRYNIPGQGVIAIWPDKKEVVIKNSKRN